MTRGTDLARRVEALRAFLADRHRMPGYTEMLALFGYRSKHAVFETLRKLEAAGYVAKQGRKIAPGPKLRGGIRLVGAVQAGFPSPAEEALLDTLSLDEFLVRNPDATFMLTVSGDSMVDAGILPGDIVLVERGARPKSGDIVVAQVDEEWTLKYFVRDRGGVRLEAANRKYAPIVPQRSLSVAGVVRTVIRKYG